MLSLKPLGALKTLALSSYLFMTSMNSYSANDLYEWDLEKKDRKYQLKVYTRDVEGSPLKAFKGVMQVNASIGHVMSEMTNHSKSCEWLADCVEYKMFEKISDNENYVYFIQNAPWPVSDRDMVAFTEASQNPETLEVNIKMKAEPDKLPKTEDNIRVPQLSALWRIVPKSENETEIIYEGHADPGGSIPNWLANAVVVTTPYKTLKALNKQLRKTNEKEFVHPNFKNYVASE